MHRKARCTYVKFRRQTAPLGPGHPSRPTNDSSSVGLPPLGLLPSVPGPYRLSDPFLLSGTGTGLTPTANVSQPPTTNYLYANRQFSFPPLHAAGESSLSRWRAYHFFLSNLVFLVEFPWMVYIPLEVSLGAWLSALADCFQLGRGLFQRHSQITRCIAIYYSTANFPEATLTSCSQVTICPELEFLQHTPYSATPRLNISLSWLPSVSS